MLNVNNLSVKFDEQPVLNGITFEIAKGEIVGVVGESGSGKSMTALAVMGLLPGDAKVKGRITLDDVPILRNQSDYLAEKVGYNEGIMRNLRGKSVSMIFQDPMTSLNPTLKIGRQIGEVLCLHTDMDKHAVHEAVMGILSEVGLTDSDKICDSYPHMLSGGMRQRVMIAMGIILNPGLLIADEPTTALDVTIQRQIISMIKKINEQKKTSVLFITHDLNLARGFCDRVIVMENGNIVEIGTVEDIFTNPQKDYTKKLIGAIPQRVRRRRAVHLNGS